MTGDQGVTIRVVLVDDHRLFRAGVRAELGDGIEVVGEAEDVASAVASISMVSGVSSMGNLRIIPSECCAAHSSSCA